MALAGFVGIVFSREKDESTALIPIRMESVFLALLINGLFLLVSILFLFGSSFLVALVINIFSPFVWYLIIFQVKLRKWRRTMDSSVT